MSWRDRTYADADDYGAPMGGRGMGGMGLGLPKPGKTVGWLLGINLGVHLLVLITGRQHSFLYDLGCMRTGALLHGQIWRLVTYQYLHSPDSAFHLIFNMIALYFLGMPLERHWGPKRFLTFYTVSGLLGGIVYALLVAAEWLRPGEMVGASGCILGLLGACAVLFPQIQIILLFFPVPIRLAAVIFVAIYVLNLMSTGPNAGGDAAHLTGLAFGVVWARHGERWAKNFRLQRRQGAWERKMRDRQEEKQNLDRILAKVSEHGIQSLTRGEKRALERATRRQQRSDRRAGRVDRL